MGLTSHLNRHYRILIRQGNYPICYLCKNPIVKQNEISQDHLIPKSLGGKTIEENLCVCHSKCNSLKGSMTVQQWFDRQRE